MMKREHAASPDRIAQERVGQDRVGQNRVAQERVGQDRVDQNRVAQDRVGQGRVDQNRVGQGRVTQDRLARKKPVNVAARSKGQAPAVRVRDLTRRFKIPGRKGAVTAVNEASLTLATGSFTAIVGASGSGKSTLMLCVAGLDQPSSGSVEIGGVETNSLGRKNRAKFRANNVGFIFQDGNLVTSLSARDNIALPGKLRHQPLDRAEVSRALQRVGLIEQARRLPSALSGGERQRVAVARVLASRPAVIFADEPTAALDVAAGHKVLGWLREASTDGSTVLMVTHDAGAAAQADRVLVMDGGQIVRELPGGNPEAVSQAVIALREAAA